MDIINFIDVVLLVSTICHCTTNYYEAPHYYVYAA